MESDLTRELQPCSTNTDLITDHKRGQLGMYSSVGAILEKNIIIQTFPLLCHSGTELSVSLVNKRSNTRPTFVKNKSVINLHIAQSKGK